MKLESTPFGKVYGRKFNIHWIWEMFLEFHQIVSENRMKFNIPGLPFIRWEYNVIGMSSDRECESNEIQYSWMIRWDEVVGMLWELMKTENCVRFIVSIFGIVLMLTCAPHWRRSRTIFSLLCVDATWSGASSSIMLIGWWNCLKNIDFVNIVGMRSYHKCKSDEIQYLCLIRGDDDAIVGILWELMKIENCHRLIVSIFGIDLAMTSAPSSRRGRTMFSLLCLHEEWSGVCPSNMKGVCGMAWKIWNLSVLLELHQIVSDNLMK